MGRRRLDLPVARGCGSAGAALDAVSIMCWATSQWTSSGQGMFALQGSAIATFSKTFGNLNCSSTIASSLTHMCVRTMLQYRLALLLLIVIWRQGIFVVEQPRSSLLWQHPRLRWFAGQVCAAAVLVTLISKGGHGTYRCSISSCLPL